MKAQRLVCTAPRRIEVQDYDTGEVPDDGVFVKNLYTAVSVGTEIYNYVHGAEPSRGVSYPRPTGYCNVGEVLEVGANVEDLAPGDLVAGQGNHASHTVLTGSYNRVPSAVEPEQAAFTVMAAIALHGVRVSRIHLGESAVVFGLGIVGQLAAALAHLSGATPVIGIDLDAFRIQRAFNLGCDQVFNTNKVDDLQAEVRRLCEEDGANVVFESTGKPGVYPQAVALACLGGRVVALGSPRGTVEMDFLQDVHLREVAILGAHQPKTPDEDHIYYRFYKNRERDLVLRLMARGRLDVTCLITHRLKPADCQDTYTMLADNPENVLGVLFDWR